MRRRPYVLLPARGLRWERGHVAPAAALAALAPGFREGAVVLDTLATPGRGAALIALPAGAADALRRLSPELRVVPVRRYGLARFRPEIVSHGVTAVDAPPLEVAVASAGDGRPLAGVTVLAFTDYAARVGAQARTGADGVARLRLGSSAVIERLYAFGALDHWSLLHRRVAPDASGGIRLAVLPFDHRVPDGLRHRYGTPRANVGGGVRVGIVDTGIALDHPDVVVSGGLNCVTGEEPTDFGPNGDEHGTHVAGIVAARGRPPTGRTGVAPGIELRSYRVFGAGRHDATNFAIAKAVDAATADGCDVVNLSLGGGGADPVIRAAIEDAQLAGVVVVAAAGNDGRGPVSFPANLPDVVAVSALGRTGTFPTDAAGSAERRGPYGDDGADFVAAFSNVGELDVTAPGVAIVSTVPGGYLDLDGTSMACPATTGVVARILSGTRRLRSQVRSPERAAATMTALHRRAVSLGFPPSLEGDGLAR